MIISLNNSLDNAVFEFKNRDLILNCFDEIPIFFEAVRK